MILVDIVAEYMKEGSCNTGDSGVKGPILRKKYGYRTL